MVEGLSLLQSWMPNERDLLPDRCARTACSCDLSRRVRGVGEDEVAEALDTLALPLELALALVRVRGLTKGDGELLQESRHAETGRDEGDPTELAAVDTDVAEKLEMVDRRDEQIEGDCW